MSTMRARAVVGLIGGLLAACAGVPGDDEPGADEAWSAVVLGREAPQAFNHPSQLVVWDTAKDGQPTVLYTRQGFIFRVQLTERGASLSVENAGDAALLGLSLRLSADCEGGWVGTSNTSVATGRRADWSLQCQDGAVPSVATVEVRAMASSASDVDHWLAPPASPAAADFSFANFPTQVITGDGSRASLTRLDANAVAGTLVNGTTRILAARLVLEGACPEARFDAPTVVDTGTQAVAPGETLAVVARCLNGVPTPTLHVRTSLWSGPPPPPPEAQDGGL